ncbi:MAG: hypothetical protein IJW46_00550 [Clostridia bacterium]|nr:hypothetical protein [Clostridia bacterium]
MNDHHYQKLLYAILATGVVLTLAHLIYAIVAYQQSSIITFIAREWW